MKSNFRKKTWTFFYSFFLFLFLLFPKTSFSQWTEIGNPSSLGEVGGSLNWVRSFTMEMVNNTPWVATTSWDDARLSIRRFNGSTWDFVGNMFQTTNGVRLLDMASDGTNVYIVYINQTGSYPGSLSVKKYSGTGSTWTSVGNEILIPNVTAPKITVTSDGTPYISYVNLDPDSASQLQIMKYVNGTWSFYGGGFVFNTQNNLALNSENNTLYVSYTTVENSNVIAKTRVIENGTYTDIATLTSFTNNPSFKVLNGELYVAHTANGSAPIVKKFNGTSWTDFGTPYNHSTDIYSVNLSFSNNLPVIVYEYSEGSVGVQKYTDSGWDVLPFLQNQVSLTYNSSNGTKPIIESLGNAIFVGYTSYSGEPVVKRYESVPSVQAIPTYTSIDASSGTLEGAVLGQGAATINQRGFVFAKKSDNVNPLLNGQNVTNYVDANATTGTFTKVVTDLLSNTEYAFKAYATNSFGTSYSNVFYFTTNVAPALQTSAGLGVNIISVAENTTSVTTLLGTDADVPAQSLTYSIVSGTDAAKFSINASTGLLTFISVPDYESPTDADTNNNYLLTVGVTDDGNPASTTTLDLIITVSNVAEIPVLSTAVVSNIGITGANFSSTIVNNGGGGSVTQKGFVYAETSTNNNPLVGGSGVTLITNSEVSSSFSSVVASLTANTNYTIKAFATNAIGTVYSTSVNFTTLTTNSGPQLIYPNAIFVAVGTAMTSISPVNVGTSIPSLTYKDISTFAGTTSGYLDDNGTAAKLNGPMGMALDGSGNVYFTDTDNHRIRKVTPAGVVTTIAGTVPFLGGGAYSDNATGTSARFNFPTDLAYDAANNCLYVADKLNDRIRKISLVSPYAVTTFAGSGNNVSTDGIGTAAKFKTPCGIKIDPTGTYLYVTDRDGNKIRRITISTTQVVTIAGLGTAGTADNVSGTSATFNDPTGIAVDANYIYITDNGGHKIRKISTTSPYAVTTIAGSGTSGSADGTGTSATFNQPYGLSIDGANNLYVIERAGNKIRKIELTSGVVTTFAGSSTSSSIDGNGTAATFNSPANMVMNPVGGFAYVSEYTGNRIRKIAISGYTLSAPMPSGLSFDATNGTITGTPSSNAVTTKTVCGYNYNGTNCTQFTINAVSLPTITTTATSMITSTSAVSGATISDAGGSTISERGICWSTAAAPTISNNKIVDSATTIGAFASTITSLSSSTTYYVRAYTITNIGVAYGQEISFTTSIAAPSISYPTSATLQSGTVMSTISVTNTGGAVPQGDIVSTFAGNGSYSYASGNQIAAGFRFNYSSITSDSSGNLYVTDTGNHAIKRISPSGEIQAYVGSGIAGSYDYPIGTNAQFNLPRGIVIAQNGTIYVCDQFNHRIRKILANGMVSTLAGSTIGFDNGVGTTAKFNYPKGLTVDANNNVYVVDTGNHCIRKITPDGTVTTFAGTGTSGYMDGNASAAQFNSPSDIVMDSSGNLFVTDNGNYKIRKISSNGLVTTFAGSTQGMQNGIGTDAQFNEPTNINIDTENNLYITEATNALIRKITPDASVTTFAGYGNSYSSGGVDVPKSLLEAGFENPYGITILPNGNIFVISDNRIRKILPNRFSISPSLPVGLKLNGDGSITGTPTQYSPVTNYTITATNAGGSSSAVIALGVEGPNQWTGAVSSAWDNPANWLKNVVPTNTDDVELIGGMPNQPTLNVDFTLGTGKTLRMLGPNNTLCQLTIAPGKTLTIDGTADIGQMPIIFKSDATGSGMLGKISGTLIPNNNGSTYVERYIPAKRAYRFLSTSVNSVAIIKFNWQSSNGPGYGTHITGAGGSSNGFDVSGTNNPSMFTFDHDAQNWLAVPNTNTLATKLIAGKGYRLMVRGDRTISLATNTPIPTSTILSSHGVIFQGDFTPTLNQSPGGYSFIGNPYQAIVDMQAVLNASTDIENQYYYIWDPTINTRGAYVAVGVQNGVNNTPSSVASKYLQPGQAFFVKNRSSISATPSITMTENHKASVVSNPSLFRNITTTNSMLKLSLISNDNQVLDGVTVLFNELASNEIDQNDASRLSNLDEELAIQKINGLLTIEERNSPTTTDIIDLSTTKYRGTNYKFTASLTNYEGPTPYLFDSFLNTFTEISTTEATTYSFDVNPNSNVSNRFKIVFDNAVLHSDEFSNAFVLFPNPAKSGESFNIQGIADAEVILYNVLGQNIPVQTVSNGTLIEVKPKLTLSSGLYIVKIKQDGKVAQVKWIIE